MEHLDYLTNRIGPRLTGSDGLQNACEWARDRFKSFGIENARLEQWGEFPVGFNRGPWSGRMVEPEVKALTFGTNSWTAGTKGIVRGKAVLAPTNEEELSKVKAELPGAWVLMPPATGGRGNQAAPGAEFRKKARGRLQGGEDRRPGPRAAERADHHRRQLPDLLGQAARDADDQPRQVAVRRDRRPGQGRQAGRARVRHPQLLQEGADPALQRDRRHPGDRVPRRVRDRRRPHRLLGRRHRRDRQRHGLLDDARGGPPPDEVGHPARGGRSASCSGAARSRA